MSSELSKRILSRLSPEAFSLAVLDAFARKEIERYLQRAGVVYPGVRIGSLRDEELASGLIIEAMQDETLLLRLADELDARHAEALRRVRSMEPKAFRARTRTLDGILDIGKPGAVVWALFRDGRAAMAAEALPFLKRYTAACEREIDHAISRGLKAGASSGEGSKKELAELRRRCARLEEEKAGTEQRLRHYKTEAERLAGEKGELAREKRGLGDMLGKLRERIASLQGGVASDSKLLLRRRVRDLQKDNERLAHDLRKARESAGAEVASAAAQRAKLEAELREARERAAAAETAGRESEKERERLAAALRAMEEKLARQTAVPAPPVAHGRRVGIFVDVQNVYYLARECYGSRLDYKKLLDAILRGRHCVKALCYIVEAAEGDQERFLKMLEGCGYTVRKRPLIRRADGSAKGNWDVGIATDVMTLVDKNRLDVVVLVTCDGDFSDLVHVLKRKGLRVEVVGFPNKTAMSLQAAADEVYLLRRDLMLPPPPEPPYSPRMQTV
jgi:uncharacterized LabA/DUF88 family protein